MSNRAVENMSCRSARAPSQLHECSRRLQMHEHHPHILCSFTITWLRLWFCGVTPTKKPAMNHSGEGGVQFHTLSGPDIFFLRQLAVLDEFFSV